MMVRPARPKAAAMVVAAAVALFAVASCTGGGSSDDAGLTDADVTALRDALEDRAFETIVRVLYEDPGARASFIARGEAEPEDAALLAEFTADGEVTFEEFRMLSDVRDAVHHYGGGVVTFFEQQVVEARRPG
jgi:hypothetical protein